MQDMSVIKKTQHLRANAGIARPLRCHAREVQVSMKTRRTGLRPRSRNAATELVAMQVKRQAVGRGTDAAIRQGGELLLDAVNAPEALRPASGKLACQVVVAQVDRDTPPEAIW